MVRDLMELPGPIVICAPADDPNICCEVFSDDLLGTCAICSAAVRYRPQAPTGSLVCIVCFIVNAPPGHFELVTTAAALEELALFAPAEES